jgi:hypothetical protein
MLDCALKQVIRRNMLPYCMNTVCTEVTALQFIGRNTALVIESLVAMSYKKL